MPIRALCPFGGFGGFILQNGGAYEISQRRVLTCKYAMWHTGHQSQSIDVTCALCTWQRDEKRHWKQPDCGTLSIYQDCPHCQIEVRFFLVGNFQDIVLSFIKTGSLDGFWDVEVSH